MPRPRDIDVFLAALRQCNGRASNAGLQQKLGWDDEKYWRLHSQLYDAGTIEKGRGYSGTVILVPTKPAEAATEPVQLDDLSVQSPVAADDAQADLSEKLLYEPARTQLKEHWSKTRTLDQAFVDDTAMQGSKETGGSWSRPDIAIVALKSFEYLPNRVFEIHTFELKASYDVTVKGVMEALTHREFATRSFVIYHTAGRDFFDFPEAARIEALAIRHGVGMYAAKDIYDFNKWAEIVPAARAAPDPDEMELFIKRSLSEGTKAQIRKWLK